MAHGDVIMSERSAGYYEVVIEERTSPVDGSCTFVAIQRFVSEDRCITISLFPTPSYEGARRTYMKMIVQGKS